ncbi:MAG TPA: VWA domain-containing protein [Thermoanaerobaculia bacterium]|nr:VWA domain-containing protein [Thermoanaerobaculia bacterium]
MKRILAILAAAAIALPVLAQKKQQEPEQPKLVENMEIRIINVDVVVTDKRGNFIPNLKAEDFTVLENGVAKPITNFYEVQGSVAKNVIGEAPVAPPPTASTALAAKIVPENMKRRIIFYVDNLSLSPFNRNRVFQEMKDFVNTVMRPGDEAMIATYNRSMKVRVPFTADKNSLITMIDGLARESGLGIAAKSEQKQTEDRIRESAGYNDAISIARTYASSVEHDLRQSVASLNALMSTLAGVEGKKILVLTSEGFPMQPGREMFFFIDDMAREKGWQATGSSMLEGMTYDAAQLIQSVAKTANANNITMYTVHAAGLTGGTEMSAEHARPVSSQVAQAAMSNTTESMMLMAEMTGGVASVQTNNFKAAFDRIETDLDSYYSLGYRAGTERVDRQRYLQVRVKNKDYRVRNRQTFVEKSMYAEMNDRVVANLLYRVKDNDLGILARIGTPVPTEDGLFHVPIDVQIPMQALTLLPQGEADYVGGFDVYVVVANKDNDMSDVARKSHQVRVPAAQIKSISGKFYTYTLELLMERGLNRISIGVVDQISNSSGFAREQIIATDMR